MENKLPKIIPIIVPNAAGQRVSNERTIRFIDTSPDNRTFIVREVIIPRMGPVIIPNPRSNNNNSLNEVVATAVADSTTPSDTIEPATEATTSNKTNAVAAVPVVNREPKSKKKMLKAAKPSTSRAVAAAALSSNRVRGGKSGAKQAPSKKAKLRRSTRNRTPFARQQLASRKQELKN